LFQAIPLDGITAMIGPYQAESPSECKGPAMNDGSRGEKKLGSELLGDLWRFVGEIDNWRPLVITCFYAELRLQSLGNFIPHATSIY
jgi:hypothetical protein